MKKPQRRKARLGSARGTPSARVRKKRERTKRAREAEPRGTVALKQLASLVPLMGAMGLLPPETPFDAAEELMFEALECKSRSRRDALARRALKLQPDCVDAYILLAMDAPDPQAARPLLEQAVTAGERSLGPRFFREEVGSFWLLLETRPYMQAREMLASCLWQLGERREACAQYQELLRLNPNDNQGIRYLLASSLLEMEEHEALARLLATYAKDATAAWAYTALLLAFRLKGPTAANRKKLAKALEANPFVPDYLLGRKLLPQELPDLIGLGEESEAMEYVAANRTAWALTPGALDWLRYASGGEGSRSTPEEVALTDSAPGA